MSDRFWERVPLGLWVSALVSGCILVIAAAVYLVGIIAVELASLSIALTAAFLLAALLEPLVAGLQRLRVPRALGALAAVLLLVTVVVAPAIVLWNVTAGQFSDLRGRIGDGLSRMRQLILDVLPVTEGQIDSLVREVNGRLSQTGANVLAGALTVIEVIAAIVLALFVMFFFLKDGPKMWAWFLARLPENGRDLAAVAGEAGWETVGRYVRGTLIVGAIDAIGIGIALVIIGVPFALPLALLVFIGGLVPYVGSTISGTVAVLVALAANGPVDALLTLAAVIAVQQLEGNLLEPLIVGRQVRLHPVVVVLAVFAGSLTGGIAGAVVAVPLTAVAYRVFRVVQDRRRGLVVPSAGELHAG
jgi:predicted PurR-regulated permease PerM